MVRHPHRETPEERASIIAKLRASGKTQEKFCKAERIAISTFQNCIENSTRIAGFSEISVPACSSVTTVEIAFPDGTRLKIQGL
jgi:hypothetical protein